MKICLSILRYSMPCGDGNSLLTLASALERMGHEVTVLTPFTKGYRYNIRQISFTNKEYKAILFPDIVRRYIEANIKISKECDIIQCHLGGPVLSPIGNIIARRTECPILINFGNTLTDRDTVGIKDLCSHFTWYVPRILINNKTVAKKLKFKCKKYVVNTNYQKSQLMEIGLERDKIHVIPNCVDGEVFKKRNKNESKKYFKLENKFVISNIGFIQYNKGIFCLLKAFARIKNLMADSILVLTTVNSKREKIEKVRTLITKERLTDSVRIFGKVDVNQLLSATDILVLPYLHNYGSHMYPNILLEGMAIGIPIVTSDLEVIREVVDPDVTALVHNPGDPGDLAQKIIALAKDEALRKQMEQIQPSIFMERYNADKCARQYETLLREILA